MCRRVTKEQWKERAGEIRNWDGFDVLLNYLPLNQHENYCDKPAIFLEIPVKLHLRSISCFRHVSQPLSTRPGSENCRQATPEASSMETSRLTVTGLTTYEAC